MAVKPILSNTDMVRALLDGRKTVTRRVVKPQPKGKLAFICIGYNCGKWAYPGKDTWKYWDDESFKLPETLTDEDLNRYWTPPCNTDDILYVRETWERLIGSYIYKADQKPGMKNPGKWRPSIHMPKEAARIFLRVTGVRMERLREITNEEIKREGVLPRWTTPWLTEGKRRLPKFGTDIHGQPYCCASHVGDCMEGACPNRQAHDRECHADPFIEVWDSAIKPAERNKYGWDANPLVWVISFERISREEAGYE